MHAPTKDKGYYKKDRFYEELDHAIDQFPKYYLQILLGDSIEKVGREDILKPTNGSESLHEINNGSVVRVVNSATS
jgi:hypothetical protein